MRERLAPGWGRDGISESPADSTNCFWMGGGAKEALRGRNLMELKSLLGELRP